MKIIRNWDIDNMFINRPIPSDFLDFVAKAMKVAEAYGIKLSHGQDDSPVVNVQKILFKDTESGNLFILTPTEQYESYDSEGYKIDSLITVINNGRKTHGQARGM